MTDASGKHHSFVVDPPSGRRDLARYGLSSVVAAASFVALAMAIGTARPPDEVLEANGAIMVDLPAVEPPARHGESGLDDETHEAANASAGQVAPREPPPVEEPAKPSETDTPVVTPETPPRPPTPDAVPERAHPTPPTPQPPASPQTVQNALQRSGSGAATDGTADQPDVAVPHASARVLLQWQKAMIERLASARRSLASIVRATGTTNVAFSIDRDGRLTVQRVSHSSGNSALDGEALRLVRHAAPFPPPPRGATDKDMSFVVPIRFKRP